MLNKKVEVVFECNECGNTWTEVYDEGYFEDEEDLENVFNESELDCPECGESCFAVSWRYLE